MKKKKILITGAAGFIGSWVTKKLVGADIVAVTSPFSKTNRLNDLRNKIRIIKVDLSDAKQIEKMFKVFRPECVIHLATHGVYQYQQSDEKRIMEGNYLMTSNLLSYSSKYGVNTFINTGSVFEYGSQVGKVSEKDIVLTDIINKYAAVKIATTALASSYSAQMKVITLRPFTTYGPTEDATRFIAATIKRSLLNESIRIVKDVIRDFVYVEDVADAYVNAQKGDFVSGSIVNIGSGKKISLEKAALIIKKLTKSKSKIILDNKYLRNKESRCWADILMAENILKWKPKHSFVDGIGKTIKYVILDPK